MKRTLRIVAITASLVVALAAVAFLGLACSTERRLTKSWDVPVTVPPLPADPARLARGEHLARALCSGCHGADLGGAVLFDDPALATVDAPNLTRGNGGVAGALDDAGWVRAIKAGVGADKRSLFIMPANNFAALTDDDVAALVAWLKTVPPVDREARPRRLTLLGRALVGAGAFGDVLSAEAARAATSARPLPPAGDAVATGAYLVRVMGCRTCHGAALAGGKDPNPEAPPGPSLLDGSASSSWSDEGFLRALRTGVRPDGRALGKFMPWETIGQLHDDELLAIRAYLASAPPP